MDLLLFGASVRAAAQSADRAGYSVVASDLFGDRDLRAIAEFQPCGDYPGAFAAIRSRFAEVPLVYTGALENQPDLLENLASIGPMYATPPARVRRLRDPFQLSHALSLHGIPYPETSRTPPTRDLNQWLLKPIQSACGHNIRRCNAQTSQVHGDNFVFQRHLEGEPVSAAFVASPDQGVHFLGATKMLVGEQWGGPHEFTYCGSVADYPDADTCERWHQIAKAIHEEFLVRGVFGIDAIQTGDELIPIEVNPRYTASMEVIEPSLPLPIMSYHTAAFHPSPFPIPQRVYRGSLAKLILYAKESLRMPAELPNSPGVRLADIPCESQPVEPGQPILTVLADNTAAIRSWLTNRNVLARQSLAIHNEGH